MSVLTDVDLCEVHCNTKIVPNYVFIVAKVYTNRIVHPTTTFPKELRKDEKIIKTPSIRNILIETEEDKKRVFDYTLNNFYTSALIPSKLDLKNTLSEYPYLKQEIDMFIDSGLSRMITDEKGSIIAAALFAVWKADKNYPVFDVTMKDWLNTGNDIATEFGRSDIHRIVIWRHYQILYMHHIGQCLARAQNKPWIVYPSLGYVNPEHRRANIVKDHMYSLHYGFQKSDISVSYTVGTYRNYFNYAKKHAGDSVRFMDRAKYADLRLIMEDGRNLLEGLENQEGITLVEHV